MHKQSHMQINYYNLFPLHPSTFHNNISLPILFHSLFLKTLTKYDFAYSTFTKRIINNLINLHNYTKCTSIITIKYKELLIDLSIINNEFLKEFIRKKEDNDCIINERLMKTIFYHATNIKVFPNYSLLTEEHHIIERNFLLKQNMINERRVHDVLKEINQEEEDNESELISDDMSDIDDDDYDNEEEKENNRNADDRRERLEKRRLKQENRLIKKNNMTNIMRFIIDNTEETFINKQVNDYNNNEENNDDDDCISAIDNLIKYIENISLGYINDSRGILYHPYNKSQPKTSKITKKNTHQHKTKLQLHMQSKPSSIINRNNKSIPSFSVSSLLTLSPIPNISNHTLKLSSLTYPKLKSLSNSNNKSKFAHTKAFFNKLTKKNNSMQLGPTTTANIKTMTLLKHSHCLQGMQLYKSGSHNLLHNKTKQLNNRVFSLPTLIEHSKAIEAVCKNVEKDKCISVDAYKETLGTTLPTSARQQLNEMLTKSDIKKKRKRRIRNKENCFNRGAPRELKTLITQTFSQTKMSVRNENEKSVAGICKGKVWIMTNKILMNLKH